ncbi:MAG: hypothetical protein VB118_07590 [Oscillospiraceae bacterium]|nr:hypothetical protein [Oscillospiraceae bacterium]
MYKYSLRSPVAGNYPEKSSFEGSFDIKNLEIDDPFFGTPLSEASNDVIEDARKALVSSKSRIVLYTVRMPHADIKAYERFFRAAHLLNIENIKLCLCTFGKKPEMRDLKEIINLADIFGMGLLFEPRAKYPVFTDALYMELRTYAPGTVGLIFNPAEYVAMGKMPFLQVLYKSKFKHDIRFLRINDALSGGEPTQIECGNAEIKECASALIARGYRGYFSFREYAPDISLSSVIGAFDKMMSEM